MLASIVPNIRQHSDGFEVHPSIVQSGAQEAKGGHLLPGAPVAVEAVFLRSKFGASVSAVWHGSNLMLSSNACNSTTNQGPSISSTQICSKLMLQGLTFQFTTADNARFKHADVFDLPNDMYMLKWMTVELSQNLAQAIAINSASAALRSMHVNVLHQSQAASLAAANMVQMLQGRHNMSTETFSLVSFGNMFMQKQLAPVRPATQSAAIQGILKNLPFELPGLRAAVIDIDVHSPASSGSYMLSAVALPDTSQADLYGAAVRGDSIFKPVLTYTAKHDSGHTSDSVAVEYDRSYIVTGGLGGLGLMTAHWLSCGGAKFLILPGRTGWTTQAELPSIVSQDVKTCLTLIKCDVSLSADAQILATIVEENGNRFGGVCHSAGTQVIC